MVVEWRVVGAAEQSGLEKNKGKNSDIITKACMAENDQNDPLS